MFWYQMMRVLPMFIPVMFLCSNNQGWTFINKSSVFVKKCSLFVDQHQSVQDEYTDCSHNLQVVLECILFSWRKENSLIIFCAFSLLLQSFPIFRAFPDSVLRVSYFSEDDRIMYVLPENMAVAFSVHKNPHCSCYGFNNLLFQYIKIEECVPSNFRSLQHHFTLLYTT